MKNSVPDERVASLTNRLSSNCLSCLCAMAMALAALAFFAVTTRAADRTWDGGGSAGFWRTNANWDADTAIVANDSLFFDGTTRLVNTNDFAATTAFNGLTFNSGAGSFVLFGNSITLNGGITNSSTTLQTINLNLVLNATRDISVVSGGTLSINSVISGATFGLNKWDAGTLTLGGANTFTGPITLNDGALRAATNATALGTGAATLTLAGGTLELAGNSGLSFSRNTTVSGNTTIRSDRLSSGAGVTHILGTLSIGAQTLTIDKGALVTSGTGGVTFGAVTLTGGATFDVASGALLKFSTVGGAGQSFTVQGAGDTTITGIIGTGTGGITKAGTGTLTMNAVNTFTGKTTVNGGTVSINGEDGLGANPGASTADQLTLDGGTLEISANVTIDDANRGITLGAGGGTFSSPAAGNAMTITEPISGAGALTKSGLGTLTLNGATANTYTGVTTVNAGTLFLNKTGGAIAIAGDLVVGDGSGTDTVTLQANNQIATSSAVTINLGGVLSLGAFSNAITSLTMTGGSVTGAGTLTNGNVTTTPIATTATINSGRLDLGGATRTFTVANGAVDPDLTVSAIIQNGALTKESTGTLLLSGANTYDGATTINAGTVRLGDASGLGTTAAGTTVAGGAVLDLSGQAVGAEGVTINGTGIGGGGVLINSSGTAASLSGAVALNTASSVGGSGNLTLSGVISGTGIGLTKVGAGNLTFSGGSANTYDGLTTVNAGTLTLSKTAGVTAIAGNLTIGDGIGTDTVTLTAVNQIADTSAVTVNLGGVLGLGGNSDAVASLTIVGGSVTLSGGATLTNLGVLSMTGGSVTTTGTGKLQLGGDVTGNANGTSATISGNLNLGGATRTFSIADGGADPDMAISAIIDNGGLTKEGAGRLTLSGANNYTGVTTLNAGTLRATTSVDALGTGASTLALAGGTLELANAAALNFARNTTVSGDVTIVTEKTAATAGITHTLGTLSIGGNILTVNEAGAVSGNQGLTFGAVTLTGAPTFLVNNNGGGATTLLTLASISNGANLLTFDGTGNTTVTGIIGAGSGGVTKKGTGTLTLSGANTFTGVLTIENGKLVVATVNSNSVAGPLGNSANAVVMGGSTGTLEYTGGTASSDKKFTLASSGTGAFQIDTAGTVLTLFGLIDGSGGLTKTGPGTLILSGGPTYGGTTTINGGVLRLNNDIPSLLFGDFNMNGGVLEWQQTGGFTLTRALSSGGSAVLLPGGVSGFSAFGGTFTINFSGTGSTVQWGSTFFNPTTFVLNAATANTNIVLVNGLDLNAADRTINVLTNIATISGAIVNNGGGTAGLIKGGSGTLILTADNTYNGDTTISAGVLQIGNGGTTGTLGAGNVTDNGGLVFNRSDAVTIGAVISGTGTVTNQGGGTLTLSGGNSYGGATAINAGTVKVQNNTSLGSAVGATFVASGTSIQIDGSGLNIAEPIGNLAGDGGGGGALRNLANNNTWSGAITIDNAGARINSDSDTLTLGAIGENGAAAKTVTFGGGGNVIVNGIISGGADLGIAKDGPGTLTLSGANTYSVGTTLNAGTLRATTSASALGTGASTLALAGGTVLELANDIGLAFNRNTTVSGSMTIYSDRLTAGAGVTHTLGTLSIGAQTLSVAPGAFVGSGTAGLAFGAVTLTGSAVFNTASGALLTLASVGGAGQNFTVHGSGNTIISGVIGTATGTLTKDGAGTLTLNGADTFSGDTRIKAGTLTLGNTLALQNSTLDMNIADAGSVSFGSLTAATFGGLKGARDLSLQNTTPAAVALSVGNNDASTAYSGILSGLGSLTKLGTGTLTLSGVSTYSGPTTINAGTLSINSIGNVSGAASAIGTPTSVANGTIKIGNVATAGTLRYTGAGHTSDRVIDLAGTTGGATLDASGSGAIVFTSDFTATGLGAKTLTLTGSSTADNTIQGKIVNSGSATSVTKSGAGTWILSGASTYTGATTINAGVLRAANSTALGTTAGGVTVSSGAALELGGGIAVGAETLTLDGTGISGAGGLRNISGDNSWAGTITINSTTRINSDSGTLTLDVATGNAITGTGDNITFGGAGNVTVNDPIATTTGTLTKDGTGTLILNGANTYSGLTTVSAGVLRVGNSTGLGTTAGGVLVTSGAALELTGGIAVGAEALTLNGTGISSGGALRNIGGANSYAGAITLGSASRINSDGGTLTISGGVTGAGNALTIGGAGDVTVSTAGISGTGTALTKDGLGTLTLNVAGTYTGGTTLSQGTLKLGAADVLPSSGTFNFAGGILDGNNQTDNTIGALTLTASSTLLFYVGGGNGKLTFTSAGWTAGTLTITGWEGTVNAAGTGDTLFVTLGSASQDFLDNIFWSDQAITGSIQLGTGEIVPVPEPINVALGVFGALFVVFGVGRRLGARARRQA